ncbi:hypothetical protein AVEN_74375-1 [Araneus ventricosus]|uniref:SOCS box domain-containing protein n=1 Tax=Araneus ventricosus TaxID=182803 RepID=A0A4Y2SN86_ARAVE|nr:hypothetical protein AVEN_74375-1 [Araneus ventricosus]
MRSLWAELEAAGETEIVERTDETLILFWIRWIRDGSQIPWIQAIRQYPDLPWDPFPWSRWEPVPRFSRIFPSLPLEDRQKFFKFLTTVSYDDLRFCLYTVTKEEEEQIIKMDILPVLNIYLTTWSLRCCLLEIVEKVWNYIDVDNFIYMLGAIVQLKSTLTDIDYCEIFERIWNRSPIHFREKANKYNRKEIDLCLSEVKRKKN